MPPTSDGVSPIAAVVAAALPLPSPHATSDLTMLAALCAATAASTPPRIAVFGGSGFIGSRVCQTLAGAGCSVVSVSRTGAPPAWAAAQPWSRQVEWLAADALADGFAESELPIGRIDGTPRTVALPEIDDASRTQLSLSLIC